MVAIYFICRSSHSCNILITTMDMASVTQFKPATLSDQKVLFEMMAPFYQHEQILSELPSAQKAMDVLLQREDLGKVWLISNQSSPIGYVVVTYSYSLEHGGVKALMDELYLDPDHRGVGIGEAIIKFLEQELRQRGIPVLYLEVNRENVVAQKLYQKHGFKDQDRLLLTKRLSEES